MPRKKKQSSKKRLQRVSVRAERRQEPDWDKFAYALLQHARILSTQKEASNRSPKGRAGRPKP
jgi:hypothetical protein